MKSRLRLAAARDTVAELLSRVGQLPAMDLGDDERDDDSYRYVGRSGAASPRRWGALLAEASDDDILAVAVRPHTAV